MFSKKKQKVETKEEANNRELKEKKIAKAEKEKPKERDYSWVSYFATDITDDLKKLESRVRQLELYIKKINERMGL